MRWLLALAVLWCPLAFPWHDHDEDEPETFKDIVQRIVRSSRENLRPLKTSRIEMHPRMDYWYEVTDVLPGARICRIYEHPQMVYKCEWKREKDIVAVQKRVAKEIGDALGGSDWTIASAAGRTRFEPVNPRRNGLVEVRVAGNVVEVLFYPVVRD